MTDPYIPLEKRLMHMRKCLEIIEKYGFGIAPQTKSDLILRDIDILKRIHEKAKCVVQMTLTTYDENLCKILEPNVCTTKRRYEVLKEMQSAGIPTVVWLTPILPFINDNEENIMGILNYCKDAGVKGIVTFGMGLTLRYGSREYYYKKLDEHFPGLKKDYMRNYGSLYENTSPHNTKLTRLLKSFCKKNDIIFGDREVFRYVWDFPQKEEQLSLF